MMGKRQPPAATLSEMPVMPDIPADETQIAARAVDRYFDSLLVDGMDCQVARLVEQQRSEAHYKIMAAALQRAMGG